MSIPFVLAPVYTFRYVFDVSARVTQEEGHTEAFLFTRRIYFVSLLPFHLRFLPLIFEARRVHPSLLLIVNSRMYRSRRLDTHFSAGIESMNELRTRPFRRENKTHVRRDSNPEPGTLVECARSPLAYRGVVCIENLPSFFVFFLSRGKNTHTHVTSDNPHSLCA